MSAVTVGLTLVSVLIAYLALRGDQESRRADGGATQLPATTIPPNAGPLLPPSDQINPPSTPSVEVSSGTSKEGASQQARTSDAEPPPQTVYLADLQYVDRNTRSDAGYYYSDGPYKADGESYSHGILMNSGCQNRDGGNYWVEFDIGKDYARITGTVALDDQNSSGVSMEYALSVDERQKAEGKIRSRQTKRLDLDVRGALRLRLLVHDPVRTSCGESRRANIIWGDLRLLENPA